MNIPHDNHAEPKESDSHTLGRIPEAFERSEEFEALKEKLLDSFIETLEEAIPAEHRRKIVKTLLKHFIK
jgi:hypothetical protein